MLRRNIPLYLNNNNNKIPLKKILNLPDVLQLVNFVETVVADRGSNFFNSGTASIVFQLLPQVVPLWCSFDWLEWSKQFLDMDVVEASRKL